MAVILCTTRCNASCVQCGMRRTSERPRMRIDAGQAGSLIESLATKGVAALVLTGGEPLLHVKDVAALAHRARRAGIASVRVSTNGFLFRNSGASGFERKIAAIAGYLRENGVNALTVGLDSPDQEVHERNRGLAGMVDGLRKGLPVFHDQGLYPTANLALSRLIGGNTLLRANPEEEFPAFAERCEQILENFFDFAQDIGFTSAFVSYPLRTDGPTSYAPHHSGHAENVVDEFSFEETAALLVALDRILPFRRSRLRVYTLRSSVLSLLGSHAFGLRRGYPCLGGQGFVFIDGADMSVSPCGYRRGQQAMSGPGDRNRKRAQEQGCDMCNWEVFRDPSNLAGPLLELRRAPLSALRHLIRDWAWTKAWIEDLAYFRACGWFDGTRPPDQAALARFSPTRREPATT